MLKDHPAVLAQRARSPRPAAALPTAEELRQLLLEAGADDAACVSLEHPELEQERPHVLEALPGTRTLISFCVRLNREPIRTPQRSMANHEFHHVGDEIAEIGRKAVSILEGRGLRALSPPMGFPMEVQKFPGRLWVVAHKTVAVAAGLGAMGIHRNVINPRFGNFILLGTLLVATETEMETRELDFNPCFECKLCVAACPVGAIGADGHFDFSACYSHNYREFMGGFTDWVEHVAEAKDAREYRSRVSDSESVSVWQSLSYGANYKAAYCMAACPAGEDVIAHFLEDRGGFLRDYVTPLQEKVESVYVVRGSDAEAHVRKRFPHKPTRPVGKVLRPDSIDTFAEGMPLVFQRGRAKDIGLDAVFHFLFHGESERQLTVTISKGTLSVADGLVGQADLELRADARSWVRFLREELGILRALLTRRLRVRGPLRLLVEFGRCFV